jgi:hypothetical protein
LALAHSTDWILQTVLSPPESEAIGYDNFPEFSWVAEKTEELLFRIGRVFQQDPEMFQTTNMRLRDENTDRSKSYE